MNAMANTAFNWSLTGLARGTVGERMVREELQAALEHQLAGAKLLSTLHMLSQCETHNKSALASCEIDNVLLTKSAAYVIEVKTRNAYCYVDENVTEVELFSSMGQTVECEPLDQNAAHTKAVHRACKVYPKDLVFNVVVMVDPLLLEGRVHEFVGGRVVTDLANVVSVIAEKDAQLRTYLPEEWVADAEIALMNHSVTVIEGGSFAEALPTAS